jgi:hypothetical protein
MFQNVTPPFVPEKWSKYLFFYSANHVFLVGFKQGGSWPSEVKDKTVLFKDFPPTWAGVNTKILTKKFFQQQCHLAKKKYRDHFFHNQEHQRLWWKYKHFFYAGEKRLSLMTQNFVTKSLTDRCRINQHGEWRDRELFQARDQLALKKLSPLMQQTVIRKLVKQSVHPHLTKGVILCNFNIYQQHDRRVQLQSFFTDDFYMPKPLIRICLLYLGYQGD